MLKSIGKKSVTYVGYTKDIKKREELREMCFNKNEVLVQGRGPYSYSINIDEADDETIMKLQKIGS